MDVIERARQLRQIIELAAESLDDQTASRGAELFPMMRLDGSLIKSGTRINWQGTLKRAAVDLWATEANTPENAPTLWEDIAYKDGWRIIPEVFTAGTAFAKDECGWWAGKLYRSIIDANVWTPAANPNGWELTV